MRALLAGLAPLLIAVPAAAAAVSGHSALALAGLVGTESPTVRFTDRAALAVLLDGRSDKTAKWRSIVVEADAVVCRASNVDIAAFACDLTFGAKKVSLTGRRAHELFATIAEAGVSGDGAAGTIYEALHGLRCTIDPPAIAQKAGGGADCSFSPGPP